MNKFLVFAFAFFLVSLSCIAQSNFPRNVVVTVDGTDINIDYDLEKAAKNVVVRLPGYSQNLFVSSDEGKNPSTVGHHRLIYRPLDYQDMKVWKSDKCRFKVGVYNDNTLKDKLFPVGDATVGQSASGFKLDPGNVGQLYYWTEYGLFEADKSGKYLKQFSTINRIPQHWVKLGFRNRMTPSQVLDLINKLGLTIKSNSKNTNITAICDDVEITFFGRDTQGNSKGSSSDPELDQEIHWYITVRENYDKTMDNFFFTYSDPQDIMVTNNPELATYDVVERKVTPEGYGYFSLKKDEKYGVADLNMNTIISPDRFGNIKNEGGMWVCEELAGLRITSVSLLDEQGNTVLEGFSSYTPLGTDGPVIVGAKGKNYYALFSRDGRQLTDFKYSLSRNIFCPEEKLVAGYMGNNLVFFDYEGNLVSKTPFLGLKQPFKGGYAIVRTDKDGKRYNVIDRNFTALVPENVLNKKNWTVQMSTEGLPPGYVFVEQYTEKEQVKDGKKTMVKDLTDNMIYNIATGKFLHPGRERKDSVFFRPMGNYFLCYTIGYIKKSDFWTAKYEQIYAIYDRNLNPIIPPGIRWWKSQILNDRYLCLIDNISYGEPEPPRVLDMITGQVALPALVEKSELGLLAMTDPKAEGKYKYIILDKDLRQVIPWHVSDKGTKKNGFVAFRIAEEEMLRDSEGRYHYMYAQANPSMRSTLEPAFTKDSHEIYVSEEGMVYASEADANSLRNRIGSLLSPSTQNRSLKDLLNDPYNKEYPKIYGRALQDDKFSLWIVYDGTGDEAYLNRLVELGDYGAMAKKGYKLLSTGDSIAGLDLLSRALEGGDKYVLTLDALDTAEQERYAEAYDKFLALGDFYDARHEAGLAALAQAYNLYELYGEEGDYFDWVLRASDCQVSLGQKWAGALYSAKGEHQRAADFYASAANQGDADAAFCAAAEYLALEDYPNQLKFLELAAKGDAPGANVMLGKLYLEAPKGIERSDEKAFTWLQQAYAQGEESVAPLLKEISLPLANAAMAEKKYRDALRYASCYCQVDSLNPEGFEILGMANYARGDYKQSLDNFNRQLALDPKNMDCIDNVQRATQKHNEAQASRARQERLNQYSKETEEAIRKGDYASVITIARSALSVAPDKAWPYADMGLAYYYLYDYPSAIASCNQALAIDNSNSRAKTYLQWSQNAIQRKEQAQISAQQQANKWQAIAELCNSTAQLMQAIGNATGGSRRSTVTPRTTPGYGYTSSSSSSSASSSHSSTSSRTPNPKYTAADVQNRKTTQMAYDGYFDMLSSMKARVYPYSGGFTKEERISIQNKMRQIRTEWNSKHPDLSINKSDLEDWDGR